MVDVLIFLERGMRGMMARCAYPGKSAFSPDTGRMAEAVRSNVKAQIPAWADEPIPGRMSHTWADEP